MWWFMLEGIALSVIGACAHLFVESQKQKRDPVRHIALGVIAGIIGFAYWGEPTNVSAIGYITAGYFAPSFIQNAVMRWRKKGAR